ncbi:1100_t:CDS:10 [Acaulospora morrowiae]|uniref:2-(3-amino-3-carboxypropyl)histidine synthase subunit 2 n=1 Tax=Acaulospora morrowiae TaxID=94023 RepID=A0A9N8V0U9_9GLOM|nr:1100_t:CDS:10 [Acaulospora morrowiae]
MSLQGPGNFSDDGSTVISRVVEDQSIKLLNSTELEKFYEIERTVDSLTSGGYETIALQFPDELLADSAEVAKILENRTQKKIFILADTSYGSCCVDEVAAQHVDAECIVHYGHSCLSPTSRLPVLYVFGKRSVDIDHCSVIFDDFFGNDNSQRIVVMYDVFYVHCVDNLIRKLREELNYINVIQSFVKSDPHLPHQSNDSACAQIQGRYYLLPEGININDCPIFYIGGESPTLSNLLLTHSKCKVYSYNPETRVGREESLHVNRALMKRYYMVQKAKDADVIGIVVGTLGVASYLTMITHLKNLISRAGKKSYTFVMGKLNVAKMANFMEIDCFVLVACPENSLIDSKEFYRPIVTPFELEMSLDPSKEWTGEYTTDFRQLLQGSFQSQRDAVEGIETDLVESDDEPHFSLVTGKLKQGRKYAIKDITEGIDNVNVSGGITDLTLRNKNTSISTVLGSAAGEFLNSRMFRGLEQNIGETEVQLAEEGRKGIARGYTDEEGI